MPKTDLSEFYKYSRPKKPPCKVGFAREQLKTDVEREQLDAALSHDAGLITAHAVVEWLGARKHTVSNPAVVSHRKRTCSCYAD
jgi:hypothetical protein